MKGTSKCLMCGKEFSWRRSKKQGAAKYCSLSTAIYWIKNKKNWKHIK